MKGAYLSNGLLPKLYRSSMVDRSGNITGDVGEVCLLFSMAADSSDKSHIADGVVGVVGAVPVFVVVNVAVSVDVAVISAAGIGVVAAGVPVIGVVGVLGVDGFVGVVGVVAFVLVDVLFVGVGGAIRAIPVPTFAALAEHSCTPEAVDDNGIWCVIS